MVMSPEHHICSKANNAVEIKNLHKNYSGTRAISDLSLNIPAGSFFGLLGPNGSGKTSTLRILATLTSADSGEVLINGINVTNQPREVRKLIGYVGQEASIDKILTGAEHLRFTSDLHHLSNTERNQRIQAIREQLDLGDWLNRRTGTYSGGMRRRLELACALLHNPMIFILDEPGAGLDPESRHLIWNVLKSRANAGQTILMSTHQLDEIELLADQVAIMSEGQVIASGTPIDLKNQIGKEKLTLKIREFSNPEEAKNASGIIKSGGLAEEVIINPCQGYALNVISKFNGTTEKLLDSIQKTGLPIFSYSKSSISLDDVYLKHTGRTLIDTEMATAGTRDLRKERKQSMR